MRRILKRRKNKGRVDKRKREKIGKKAFKVFAMGAFFAAPGGGVILTLFHGFKILKKRRKKKKE